MDIEQQLEELKNAVDELTDFVSKLHERVKNTEKAIEAMEID